MVYNKDSFPAVECPKGSTQARKHGYGGFYYHWHQTVPEDERVFPRDVSRITLFVPWRSKEDEPWAPEAVSLPVEHIAGTRATRLPESSEKEPWIISGTKDKPTLSPSIDCINNWHGHLVDGEFRSC